MKVWSKPEKSTRELPSAKREDDQCQDNTLNLIKYTCICEPEKQDARSKNRLQSRGLVNVAADGLSKENTN